MWFQVFRLGALTLKIEPRVDVGGLVNYLGSGFTV